MARSVTALALAHTFTATAAAAVPRVLQQALLAAAALVGQR